MIQILDITTKPPTIHYLTKKYIEKNIGKNSVNQSQTLISFLNNSKEGAIVMNTEKCTFCQEEISDEDSTKNDGFIEWSKRLKHFIEKHHLKLPKEIETLFLERKLLLNNLDDSVFVDFYKTKNSLFYNTELYEKEFSDFVREKGFDLKEIEKPDNYHLYEKFDLEYNDLRKDAIFKSFDLSKVNFIKYEE
ncbi:hypothetical protein [Aureivirga sp. CE67]|uniref:hypothetical protein n=1 Tax=Aureivirga sp. CE67 TaxID=1788983 RepID=UPI0018C8F028|nr:hypothetical protein [Aureivirga sp. CE67]